MDSVQYVSSTLFLPGSDRETKMWNSAVKKIVLHEDFTKLIEEQSLICPFSYHILFVCCLLFVISLNLFLLLSLTKTRF